MKEPKRIKLTDNPSTKDVNKIPLENTKLELDIDTQNYKTFWKTLVWENENNSQNDSQSIQ